MTDQPTPNSPQISTADPPETISAARCHRLMRCGPCGARFTSLTAFDMHQYPNGGSVVEHCDPTAPGRTGGPRLELKPCGCWGQPSTPERDARFAAMRSAAPSSSEPERPTP